MITIFEHKQTGEGVFFNRIVDERFKINSFAIAFQSEFDEISRPDYAAAAYMISHCCREYPTNTLIEKHLSELYDASLSSNIHFGKFKNRVVLLNAGAIGNSYAFGGEDLEVEISKLIRSCVIEPLTNGEAFDKKTTSLVRDEIIDSIDSVINEKSAYAAERSNKTAYAGEFMETPILGTHEQAEKITPESAYAAYKRLLETSQIEIYAAGSSDFKAAEEILGSMFSDIKRGNIAKLEPSPSTLKPEPVYVSDRFPMQQGILRITFKAPELEDSEAVSMLSMILGVLPTSRFFQNIREKQSLCYYCSCIPNKNLRTLTAYAGVQPQNLKRTEEAIIAELEKIQKDGVTEEEIEMARLDAVNTMRSTYDSTSSLIAWYAGRSNLDEFRSPEEQCKKLLEVDAARIQAAARSYKLDTVYTLSGGESN